MRTEIRGPRRAWVLVRAHARMHHTGEVKKQNLIQLTQVARCNGAQRPALMAVVARQIWPD